LLLRFVVNALGELGDLALELLVRVLVGGVARGEGLAELAFIRERRAVIEEVLRFRHAAVRVLELRARFRVLLREHQLLAFFIQARSDLGLALRVRDAAYQRGREDEPQR
jgi:hypothetical protein